MCKTTRLIVLAAFFIVCNGFSNTQPELLTAQQAFPFTARIESGSDQSAHLVVKWTIADGYYLYQKKFKFVSQNPAVQFGHPKFPASTTMQDEFFGEVKIHRDQTTVSIPIETQASPLTPLAVSIGFQGCADIGICYPPQTQQITVDWPKSAKTGTQSTPSGNPFTNVLNSLVSDSKGQSSENELLPSDQAFQFNAEATDVDSTASQHIALDWTIAPDYYLYREQFSVRILNPEIAILGHYNIPHGKPKFDAEYGQVEVFYNSVNLLIPLLRKTTDAFELELEVSYQGCAEIGVCYPPVKKTVSLQITPGAVNNSADSGQPLTDMSTPVSEQDRIATALSQDNFWWTGLVFLGFGLMLAFTPCCFPMIPILAGIIVGQGEKINTWHAFWLSLSYVLGSAVTYTIFGVLAGLFGSNLQALFQNPWLLGAFSALFVFLALSMFGLFELQLPSSIQTRLNEISTKQKSGSFLSAIIMGILSALIVGPCVAAPLAGALIYIGQTGDATIGGFALFMMALGMGIPLLIVGTSAGKLLPKAGAWMGRAKVLFGFIMLGVAIWLLERILPGLAILLMWALMLICCGVYLGALDTINAETGGYRRLFKSVGLVLVIWGILGLIGAASGARDISQPLSRIGIGNGSTTSTKPMPFKLVRSTAELDNQIAQAASQGQWVMLDYYADWCISCKEMERDTFSDPSVQDSLSDFVLLKADVTQNNVDDKALLDRFALIGPPATLFFGPDKQERKGFRIVGYKPATDFISHLNTLLSS
ncbi:MAG: protein-disulfide reductase DsbD [Gammaproteobacteria bacterium]|nr:protein-disulfide reductase DsbD [Gammaproteobacteria bacterium]